MSDTDVSQLSKETLADGAFPAVYKSDFRMYFEEDVHAAISSHAGEDTSIEICGVIIGLWHRDDDGPFARITNFIRCDDAASKNTEVTFTHQSWSQINEEMDSKYADKRIIGWYHSHPDFGIFLSDRDMFIQEHFFSGPGQVAYVVDPVRKLEGVFEWRQGKAELMSRYWAGHRLIPREAASSEKSQVERLESPRTSAGNVPDQPRSPDSPLSMTSAMLAALCLFLIGMLFGEWRGSRQQQYLAEGAIAHYGLWNLLQIGRSEQVENVRKRVTLSFDDLSALAEEQSRKFDGDERTAVRKKFQIIRKHLAQARDDLQVIESVYSVPAEQREFLATVVASHLAAAGGIDNRKRLPIPVPVSIPTTEEDEDSDKVKKPSDNKSKSPDVSLSQQAAAQKNSQSTTTEKKPSADGTQSGTVTLPPKITKEDPRGPETTSRPAP